MSVKNSQRTFAGLTVAAMCVCGFGYAILNHTLPTLDGSSSLVTAITPLSLVILTLKHLFDVIDNKVASGSIQPGDIIALLSMSEFYIAMVTCLSGILQTIGLKVIDPTAQALLVDVMMGLSNVLLRSFSNRPPLSTEAIASQPVTPQTKPKPFGEAVGSVH